MPHRIFSVQELVLFITNELVECSYSRWDVVSLALTCRALESPALSVLWARQTMLAPLIRVLPPDTLKSAMYLESPEGSDEMMDWFSEEEEELVRNFNFPSNHISFSYSISC